MSNVIKTATVKITPDMKIEIISGEGEIGARETYTGARTLRALRSRLSRERANGERQVRLLVDGQDCDI